MIVIDVKSAADEPGITLDRVHFGYGAGDLLTNMSWELDAGHNAVITGGSGSGKSTLLLVAAGLLPPSRGVVLLGGHPVLRLPPSERMRRGLRIGFVFQDGGLFANVDTYSNVSLALYYHQDVLGLDDDGVIARTEEALDTAQIAKSHWKSLPAHLSFGDRKRLSLARAIALKPNFFFFDDPDVGMDQRTARVAHQALVRLRDDPEVTLMVATNRSNLIEQLDIPGFRLDQGILSEVMAPSVNPPSWNESRQSIRITAVE